MKRITLRDSVPDSESDFPPVLLCAACGQATCSGCDPRVKAAQTSEVAFEGTANMTTLWSTVISCSVEPSVFFGRRLVGPGLRRAFVFALFCEMLALGSVFLVLGLILVGLLPGAASVLLSSAGATVALGLWVGSIAFLLGVHVLWGLTLLAGVDPRPPGALRLGLRFGMYACGWDLLTSPAGVVLVGILGRGPNRFEPLWKAARAPRPAMNALLADGFALSEPEQKRAFSRAGRAALVWFGLTVLLFVALVYLWLARTDAFIGLQWG